MISNVMAQRFACGVPIRPSHLMSVSPFIGSMPFRMEIDNSYAMHEHTIIARNCGGQGVERKLLELGHAQVDNGNRVFHRSKTSGCCFSLLQQTVHGLDIGVAASVQHAPQDSRQVRLHGV